MRRPPCGVARSIGILGKKYPKTPAEFGRSAGFGVVPLKNRSLSARASGSKSGQIVPVSLTRGILCGLLMAAATLGLTACGPYYYKFSGLYVCQSSGASEQAGGARVDFGRQRRSGWNGRRAGHRRRAARHPQQRPEHHSEFFNLWLQFRIAGPYLQLSGADARLRLLHLRRFAGKHQLRKRSRRAVRRARFRVQMDLPFPPTLDVSSRRRRARASSSCRTPPRVARLA